jgi:hypothetical protein
MPNTKQTLAGHIQPNRADSMNAHPNESEIETVRDLVRVVQFDPRTTEAVAGAVIELSAREQLMRQIQRPLLNDARNVLFHAGDSWISRIRVFPEALALIPWNHRVHSTVLDDFGVNLDCALLRQNLHQLLILRGHLTMRKMTLISAHVS